MDYVLTALARIQATKFDEATQSGGLLPQLESHRDYLSSEPGYHGMSITRSANPEGDVQLVIETRWANNNALADYSSREPNIASIFNANQDLLVSDSVQILRMQSETPETQDAPNRVYDRLGGALLWPVGILAFAVLVIYALSRIYLVLPGNWATPLAAGVAILILLITWYFASHPAAPRWQWAGTAIVVLGVLGIAGTGAAIYDNNHEEVLAPPTPPPAVQSPPPGGTPVSPGAPQIDMGDDFFVDVNGNKNADGSFSAKSGETITIQNNGEAIHNVHVSPDGNFAGSCSATTPGACSKPAAIPAGQGATIVVTLPAGTYKFRCDFHPDQMQASITIQ